MIRNLLIYVGIPLVLLVIVALYFSMQPTDDHKTSEIVYMFKDNKVKEYSLDFGSGELVLVKTNGEKMKTTVASIGLFLEAIDPYVKDYNEKNDTDMVFTWKPAADNTFLLSILPNIIIIVVFIVVWLYIMRKLSDGLGDPGHTIGFGKARVKNISNDKRKTTFADVAGADEEKEELKEVVEFLKSPKKFNELGARIPKGVLLVGPPGTGKTLLARAVAGEAGVPFFSISGSDFVEMFVGVGASRVRDLFNQAKKESPCIIFIDEIDAVGRQRGAGITGGHDEREQTLNQLLVEMDGFGVNEGVIMIAATNRPDVLDPALMRPGRFDRQVVVGRPDIKGREEILKVHAKGKPLAPDVDLKTIAKTTAGFTGADLENLLNEAALLAARKDLKAITMEEVEEATIKVVVGTEKKSRVMSDKEKKLTAYHEAGHAIATYCCPTQDPVHEISIIPRGLAGGYTMSLPSEDRSYRSKKEMLEEIVVLLGGRVAEALILGDISTGASNDIERATKLVISMITKYGMSEKLGPITYGSSDEGSFLGREFGYSKSYSEDTASVIDSEVKDYITKGYKKTEEILNSHMPELHRVAQFLFENEKMTGEQFVCAMENKEIPIYEDKDEDEDEEIVESVANTEEAADEKTEEED